MSESFKPIAYIKEGCPYSMKFLRFIEQEQLQDEIDIVRCRPGTPVMNAVREKLEAATHDSAQFPTVAVAPGEFRTESNDLIRYFAEKYDRQPH